MLHLHPLVIAAKAVAMRAYIGRDAEQLLEELDRAIEISYRELDPLYLERDRERDRHANTE